MHLHDAVNSLVSFTVGAALALRYGAALRGHVTSEIADLKLHVSTEIAKVAAKLK